MYKVKRFLSILLVLTCMFGILGISASAVDGDSTVGIVTASALRLRKSASTGSAILAIVSKGQQVTVLSNEGDWCKVQYGGTVGYMSTEYLSLTSQAGTSSGSSSGSLGTAKIAYTVVNLRSGASTSASLVCQAHEGDSVTLLELDNGWYKVSYKDKTAYVRSDLVNVDGASSGGSTSSGSSSTETPSENLGTGKISSNLVNLRSGPATSYSIVYQVPYGTSITLLELKDNWYKISYKNQTVYVRSDLVSTDASSGSSSSSSGSSSGSSSSSSGLGTAKIAYTVVNLRSGASTGSSLVCQAHEGDTVTLLELDNGWYKVSYKGKTAYVRSDLVNEDKSSSSGSTSESGSSSTETPSENLGTGKISGSLVNLRSGPATSYSIVYQVPYGTSVTLLELNNDWYKVSYKNKTAYVRSDLVSTGSTSESGSSSGSSSSTSGSAGEAIVAKAKEYLGCPYVWGGISPKGFDCSGFTYYVLRACDYKISRLASAQMSSGIAVSRNELQPGDLVFFSNTYTTGLSHVGIYIGNGQIIHAANSKLGVIISDMAGYYDDHYYGACRVW